MKSVVVRVEVHKFMPFKSEVINLRSDMFAGIIFHIINSQRDFVVLIPKKRWYFEPIIARTFAPFIVVRDFVN